MPKSQCSMLHECPCSHFPLQVYYRTIDPREGGAGFIEVVVVKEKVKCKVRGRTSVRHRCRSLAVQCTANNHSAKRQNDPTA